MVIGIDASRANIRQRTGTENYSWYVIRHMVELDRSITFILYFDGEPLQELRDLGPNVRYRVLHWRLGLLWSQLRLSWEMIWRRPDVLFVPAHTIPLVHPRTVTTVHDLGFERFPELYADKPIGGSGSIGQILKLLVRLCSFGRYGTSELDYHRWSARFAVRHATRLITVSEFTKREMVDRYRLPPDSITVIHHGIDEKAYQRPSDEVIRARRAEYGIEKLYFVYVGRLEKKKNTALLIDAFVRFRKSRPDVQLVLIGKKGFGWERADKIIRDNGLTNEVRVLGWIPNEASTAIVAGASAFVFLSEYEGFGMPILESYCIGTPVIASTNASIPEVAGDAAILVSVDDREKICAAMTDILDRPSHATELVRRGKVRVREFTWTSCASQTLEVLRAAAGA